MEWTDLCFQETAFQAVSLKATNREMPELHLTPPSKEWKNRTIGFPGEGIHLTLFLKLLAVGVGTSMQRKPGGQVGEGGRMRRRSRHEQAQGDPSHSRAESVGKLAIFS